MAVEEDAQGYLRVFFYGWTLEQPELEESNSGCSLMFLEDMAARLKGHAARFDLEQRAIAGCKQNLRTLLAEEPEEARFYLRGLGIEELEFVFQKHQLVFGAIRSWPHILSRVTFGRSKKHSFDHFGYYSLETVEAGEVNDDWFSWEQMRDEEGKLTEFSRVLD